MQKTLTSFGQWLAREIENREETRTSFAHRIGVSRDALHRWLQGHSIPRGDNLSRIARGLEIERGEVDRHLSEAA